jgi:CBS domain-containing protein
MQASDIMTHEVITARRDTPLDHVVQLMLMHRISGLPVVVDNTVVGIISENDLLRRPEMGTEQRRTHWLKLFSRSATEAADYVRTHGLTAGEVMTTDVASVNETTPVEEIARTLDSRGIKRVPVLRNGRLVGIVSRADLLRSVGSRVRTELHAGDREIRTAVLTELSRHPSWAPRPAEVSVHVQNGVVHYWGTVRSTAQRQAMIVAAERLAGVHQLWREPDPLFRPNWPSPGRP